MLERLAAAGLAGAVLAGCQGAPPPATRVVVAYPSGPTSLVPHVPHEEFALSVLSNVFEPLLTVEAELRVVPVLAESWQTPDDRTWVFRLKDGVRFHDGVPVEAAHVVASLERIRRDLTDQRAPEIGEIESIAAPDARTVVIKTLRPFGPRPNKLVVGPIWRDPERPGGFPVGTGPYKVQRWTPGGDVALEAFADYRNGPPSVRLLEFRVIPRVEDRLAGLRQGQVNLMVDVPAEEMASLESLPSVRTLARRGRRVVYLGMDSASARSPHVSLPANPFQERRVRLAVKHALDREALVRGPLGGYAEVVEQVVTPEVFGYHPKLSSVPCDRGRAGELLQQSGHAKGFTVALDYPEGKYRGLDGVVKGIVADLAQVGIVVQPRPAETGAFLERLNRRDSAFYLLGWMAIDDAAVSYEFLFHSPASGQGGRNAGGYANAEVDVALEKARTTAPERARRALLQRVAEVVQEDVPVIPLYCQSDLYALSEKLEFQPGTGRTLRGSKMRWRP